MMLSADLSELGEFIGAAEGYLKFIDSKVYQDSKIRQVGKRLKKDFLTDAIAANLAGYKSIAHAFEWGPQDNSGVATGGGSGVPLFKVKFVGSNTKYVMSYDFLPSNEPVPLPSPEKFGFDPSRLDYLNRHVFRMKATVMESGAMVTISPKNRSKLFIPTTSSPTGFVFSRGPVTINPGGSQATGGFANFWNSWFSTKGEGVTAEMAELIEEELGATGRKIFRRVAGHPGAGQFASGQVAFIQYINHGRNVAEAEMSRLVSKGDVND